MVRGCTSGRIRLEALGEAHQRLGRPARVTVHLVRFQVDEGTFGITIFEAPDEVTARAVMQTDPAVSAGVMSAELYPYAVAAARDGLAD